MLLWGRGMNVFSILMNENFLCNFQSKKPFLHQEVWACWRELLSYLDAENKWLNEIEVKLKATENVQGGAEEISESLDVSADLNNNPVICVDTL